MTNILNDIYTNWRDVMSMPIRAVNTPQDNIVSNKYVDKKPWLLKRSRFLKKKKGHTIRCLHNGGRIDSKGIGSHLVEI